jgi:hypothetical protein
MGDLTNFFQQQGYVVLDNAVPEESLLNWEEVFDRLNRAKAKSLYDTVHWYKNLLEHCPESTFRALSHEPLLDCLECLMGPFVQYDGGSLVGFEPVLDTSLTVRGYHRDRYAHFPTGAYQNPSAIHALFYLQDLANCGPLRIIPRSHVEPIGLTPEEETKTNDHEILLYPKRGQVVLLHNCLLHSGSLHHSSGIRRFVSVCFNHSFMKRSDVFSGPSAKRILEIAKNSNDRRLQRLMGYGDEMGPGINRSNCGFLLPEMNYWPKWISEDRSSTSNTENRNA